MSTRTLAPCQAMVSIEDGETLATQLQQHIDRIPNSELGHATVALKQHLDAVSTLLTLHVRELDQRALPDLDHNLSTTRWLGLHCQMSSAEASGTLKTARALAHMPSVVNRAVSGEIPQRSVQLLAQARDRYPDEFTLHEGVFADTATYLTVKDLRRAIGHWEQQVNYDQALTDIKKLDQLRSFHHSQTYEGLWATKGTFSPEGGHIIKQAVDAICDPKSLDAGELRSPAQRRADAMVDICVLYLNHDTTRATSSGQRPHVTVTVDYEILSGRLKQLPEIDGAPVTPDTMRRITCDAGIIPMVLGSVGEPLDVGRRTRTIPTAIRRALEQMYNGCTWAGCNAPQSWCDAHHIIHWADGGDTSLPNLTILCRKHHTATHRQDRSPPDP
jgi:hypothetical protein